MWASADSAGDDKVWGLDIRGISEHFVMPLPLVRHTTNATRYRTAATAHASCCSTFIVSTRAATYCSCHTAKQVFDHRRCGHRQDGEGHLE